MSLPNRRNTLAGLLALAAGPAAAAGKAPGPRKAAGRWGAVETVAQKMIDDRLVPGLQICVRKRGAAVFSKGFGKANLETATAMTPASVCKIGSITKQFTAAAILLLAQDGQLSLNDALSVYLPEFPNAGKLQLRRMLSHTSGLGNYTNNPRFMQMSRTDRTTAELLQVMVESSPKLDFEPGTDWRYSNTAFVLLGVLVEKLSGKPYAEFMQSRLFTPLGLTHTAVDDASPVVPNRAAGYSDDTKAPSGFDNTSFIAMTFPGGAGAMRSTCEDLCAWHAALLGGKVLKPEMLKEMLTPATLNDGSIPAAKSPTGETRPIRYGFGLALNPVDGRPSVGHDGGIQGFASHLETATDDRFTIATVMNTDGGPKSPPALRAAPGELQKALRAAALAA